MAALLNSPVVIKYEDIPMFPTTTVQGHSGELVFGTVGESNTKVVLLKGRFHFYEGHSMQVVGLPGRLFKLLGCEVMITTNAAGGINRSFNIGDVMIITDHIALPLMSGNNPLVGSNDAEFGPRFPAMSSAYDASLRKLVLAAGKELGFVGLRSKGVYSMVSGPNYETGAESLFLKQCGADAVGMSTIPEVTMAVHSGLRVLGLSLITNKVVLPGDTTPAATHEEVLATVSGRTEAVQQLVQRVLAHLGTDSWEKCLPKGPLVTDEAETTEATLQEALRAIDVDDTTPMEALVKLKELKKLWARTSGRV